MHRFFSRFGEIRSDGWRGGYGARRGRCGHARVVSRVRSTISTALDQTVAISTVPRSADHSRDRGRRRNRAPHAARGRAAATRASRRTLTRLPAPGHPATPRCPARPAHVTIHPNPIAPPPDLGTTPTRAPRLLRGCYLRQVPGPHSSGDRASASGAEGRRFESFWGHQVWTSIIGSTRQDGRRTSTRLSRSLHRSRLTHPGSPSGVGTPRGTPGLPLRRAGHARLRGSDGAGGSGRGPAGSRAPGRRNGLRPDVRPEP